ncbi:hypothetical protein [Deinococcus multiflagellatus]|uniref:Uncharacterized protein n=1 Tax=Deinococcus multiflagellatus TaxID=1656887 RepID=A0ABW1ZSL4_9DEIO
MGGTTFTKIRLPFTGTFDAGKKPHKAETNAAYSAVEVAYDTLVFTPDGPNTARSTAPLTWRSTAGFGMPRIPLARNRIRAPQGLNGGGASRSPG